jgi:putative oxidoreductase
MSIGLLLLRLVVGLLLVGHGTQKLFGWFGGGGLDGTTRTVESLGYRPGRTMAVMSGGAEALGGLSLALGFITPLGSAAIIGAMLNAILAVHLPNGVWNTKGGFEFPLTNATVAAALAFTGPGRFSIDHAIGFEPGHVVSGSFALLLGLVVGIIVFASRRPQQEKAVPSASTN